MNKPHMGDDYARSPHNLVHHTPTESERIPARRQAGPLTERRRHLRMAKADPSSRKKLRGWGLEPPLIAWFNPCPLSRSGGAGPGSQRSRGLFLDTSGPHDERINLPAASAGSELSGAARFLFRRSATVSLPTQRDDSPPCTIKSGLCPPCNPVRHTWRRFATSTAGLASRLVTYRPKPGACSYGKASGPLLFFC